MKKECWEREGNGKGGSINVPIKPTRTIRPLPPANNRLRIVQKRNTKTASTVYRFGRRAAWNGCLGALRRTILESSIHYNGGCIGFRVRVTLAEVFDVARVPVCDEVVVMVCVSVAIVEMVYEGTLWVSIAVVEVVYQGTLRFSIAVFDVARMPVCDEVMVMVRVARQVLDVVCVPWVREGCSHSGAGHREEEGDLHLVSMT